MKTNTPTIRPRNFLHRAYKHFTPLVNSKKSSSYFAITLSLVSLSFFGLFAIRPTLITAATLITSVSDLEKLNIQYEEKISNLVRAQAEYEKIRDGLPFIRDAIPGSSSFPQLAKAIERFADQSNVSIIQLSIDGVPLPPPSAPNKLFKYGFNLIGTGDYLGINSFITHLLNWRRIVLIDSIEFNSENSSPSGHLKVAIKGSTYYEQ